MSVIGKITEAFQAVAQDIIDLRRRTGAPSYESRALAQNTNIPAVVVLLRAGGLDYKRDPAGTALTTKDGARWSPSGDVYPEHFGAVGNDETVDCAPALTAALAYTPAVNLRGWTVYYCYGPVSYTTRLQLKGPGAANADNLVLAGAPKLVFRGGSSAVSCFQPAAGVVMLNHAKFEGFSLRCEGNYAWMFDCPRTIQVSWVDISATAVGMNTGGIKARKINATDSAWLNQINRCNIILPTDASAPSLDQDWSDSVIQASSLSGGVGCIERSYGNKWLMNNIERSKHAGVTLLKLVANVSSLFIGNLFDANAVYGVLIDVSQDPTAGLNVNHVFLGNKFRTVHPTQGTAGTADIGYINGTGRVYSSGITIGNYHGVATVPQYSMDPAQWVGMISGLDTNLNANNSLFDADADPRTYFGRNGINVPAGLAFVRGARTVYGMAGVAGFFGAPSGQGAGVLAGSVAGTSPFLGSSRDRTGAATDLRLHTDNAERLRLLANGTAIRPGADNSTTLGASGYRWSTIFSGTGAINTSDQRAKTDIREINQAEARVAQRLRRNLRAYRMVDAVAEKGDDARVHFGIVAQEVAEAFLNEGLNPHSYALFCHDEWAPEPALMGVVVDDDGNETEVEVEPAKPGGDRYGIRYDELVCFILAGLE